MICESVVEELVVWHGAPMAAVTRAFGVFGLESERVPGDVLDGLRRLKELYARPAPGFRRIGVYRGWDQWMVGMGFVKDIAALEGNCDDLDFLRLRIFSFFSKVQLKQLENVMEPGITDVL